MAEKLKLHNAMWPGLVGKASQGGDEPDIELDAMLDLTANARAGENRFDGITCSCSIRTSARTSMTMASTSSPTRSLPRAWRSVRWLLPFGVEPSVVQQWDPTKIKQTF